MSTVLPVWTLLTWVLVMVLWVKVFYLEKTARDLRRRSGVKSPGQQLKAWAQRQFGRASSESEQR